MKPKFTPGPWQMQPDSWYGDHAEISSADWGALALVVNKVDGKASEAGAANAHLIAAAPDMYAMLNTLCDRYPAHSSIKNDIQFVLAKARGEA